MLDVAHKFCLVLHILGIEAVEIVEEQHRDFLCKVMRYIQQGSSLLLYMLPKQLRVKGIEHGECNLW